MKGSLGARREQRLTTTRRAMIGAMGRQQPGAILDLSRHGMRIETATPLIVGQRVYVSSGVLCFVEARVAWFRRGVAGLRLTDPLPQPEPGFPRLAKGQAVTLKPCPPDG